MKISEAFPIALAHHQAGRLEPAAEIYRRILEVGPQHADALHLLGVIAHQTGRHALAIDIIGRAIELNPGATVYHGNLGEAYRALGRSAEAMPSYQRALQLNPDYVEAHNGLGLVLREQGRLAEAMACYRRALELKPDYAEAHNNLGAALQAQERLADAVTSYRRALELKPEMAEARVNLGVVFQKQCLLDQAVASYRQALQRKPDSAEAHTCLGTALREQGKLDEALACQRRAVELKPDSAEAHNNLAVVHKERGEMDEALAACRRAVELRPDFGEAYGNLGGILKDAGQLDEAVAACRRAVELRPDHSEAHSNLLYMLHFCPAYDARTLYEEHRRWNQRHAAPLAGLIRPHPNERSPERRLRIGYVSPDFRGHPVGRFLLPLLEAHDRRAMEVFCYSSVPMPDPITDRCRAAADVWRDVAGLSDEQLAGAVREDHIDVLADLTMHMARSRLLAFARKPAPVQVTYLAYCGTTGLETMDYRLTEPYLDPPGTDERCYCEQTVRLAETYWCYRPIIETPEVNGLPASEEGHVTFGSLNNFCKNSPPAIEAWLRILQAVPGSRLLLHAHPGSHRDRLREFFDRGGVAPERLTFVKAVPLWDYYQIYQQIDVALDPFPYGGGTTTCDALWMGVPAVSLAGRTGVGRGGVSILSNLGLPELIAGDVEQYVRIATELAGDLPRLSRLRVTLRQRMQDSPLMDAPRFARNVEAAYRMMWRRWCAREQETV